jgi:O-methyltransferase
MYKKTKAKVKIFPSHYFIPEHFLGEKYEGTDKIYVRQMWGSTTRCYTAGMEGREKEGMTMIEKLSAILAGTKGKKFIMLGDGHIDYILKNLASVLDLSGDVVELGCNVGVTSSYIKRFLTEIKSDKELHVYDSFEGLPPKTAEDGATPCEKGHSAVSVEQFKKTFADAGVELPVINKGFFGDLADDKYPEKICFAFFDGDFYGSIMDSFKKVYDKMTPGGIVLIHDYEYAPFPGVKKACDDFLRDKPEVIVRNIFGIGKMVKE